jgi:hypothetical protein
VTDYPFGMQLAVAALDENNIIRDGEVWIYAPSDTEGISPLDLTDLSGLPLVNPLRSNAYGNTRPFVTNVPQVKWKSGSVDGLFDSFTGMRDEAVAAKTAAQTAQTAALAASESALSAADTAGTAAAAAAAAQMATATAAAATSATAATNSATSASTAATQATTAQTAATAAAASAAAAAAVTAGGGFAVDPSNANVLLISTLDDGSVAVDPTNSNVLLITI